MTGQGPRVAIFPSAVQVDVTDPDSAAAMCARVLDRWGRVDVLVNNAGVAGPTAPVADYPPGAWHQVIAVNLTGVFHCTRACLPPMTAETGAYQLSAVLIAQGGDREAAGC